MPASTGGWFTGPRAAAGPSGRGESTCPFSRGRQCGRPSEVCSWASGGVGLLVPVITGARHPGDFAQRQGPWPGLLA